MFFPKTVTIAVCCIIGFVSMLLLAQENTSKSAQSTALELQKAWGVKEQIEALVLTIEKKLPADQRHNFQVKMAAIIDYDAILDASAEVSVDVFSKNELEKMLEYYSSEHGKSAESKRVLYNQKFMPRVQALIKEGMAAAAVPPSK